MIRGSCSAVDTYKAVDVDDDVQRVDRNEPRLPRGNVKFFRTKA